MAARDRDKIFELVAIKHTSSTSSNEENGQSPNSGTHGSAEGYRRIIQSAVGISGSNIRNPKVPPPSTIFVNNALAQEVELQEDSSSTARANILQQDHRYSDINKAATQYSKRVLYFTVFSGVVLVLLVFVLALLGVVLSVSNSMRLQKCSADIEMLQQLTELNHTLLMKMAMLLSNQVDASLNEVMHNISFLSDGTKEITQSQSVKLEQLNYTLSSVLQGMKQLDQQLQFVMQTDSHLQQANENITQSISALANQAYIAPTCYPQTLESPSNGLMEVSTSPLTLVS